MELFAEYEPGLRDIAGFDRLWLIYLFDRASEAQLVVRPYLDTAEHGVFATRSPARPNKIGLSSVRLLRVEGARLYVADVDMLDGSLLAGYQAVRSGVRLPCRAQNRMVRRPLRRRRGGR